MSRQSIGAESRLEENYTWMPFRNHTPLSTRTYLVKIYCRIPNRPDRRPIGRVRFGLCTHVCQNQASLPSSSNLLCKADYPHERKSTRLMILPRPAVTSVYFLIRAEKPYKVALSHWILKRTINS